MYPRLLRKLMLILTVVCPMALVNSQFIQKDTTELQSLTDSQDYKKCISESDKAIQKYLDNKDSMSAYWVMTKKLNCLAWNKEDDLFIELSDQLLNELEPKQFVDVILKIREIRFHFYYNRMNKAYLTELQECRILEKEYGTNGGYVNATLSYLSTDIYSKDKGSKVEMYEELKELTTDTSQLFRIYYNWATVIMSLDKDKALGLFEKASTYIEDKPLHKFHAPFHREFSRFLLTQGMYSKSISEGLKAVEIYNLNEQLVFAKMDMYRVISRACLSMKQYDRAREYIDLAINIADEKKYKFRDDIAKDNAELLIIEGDFDLAEREFRRCIDYHVGKKLYGGALGAYSQLGMMQIDLGNMNKAKNVHQEIRELLSSLNKEKLTNNAYRNFLGHIYQYEGQTELAIKQFLALADLDKKSVSLDHRKQGYEGLSKIYAKQNDFSKAYKYNKLHQQVKDFLTETANTQIALQMESEFNRKGQNNVIAMLDQENEIQELTLSNQKNTIIFGSILLLALGMFSALLIGLFRKVKSQNLTIVKALEEKDVLLKEIHHRVKNNLQLVSSLLTLQSRDVTDESALQALQAGKSRVRSMALIHQDLYSADNLKGISMKKYLTNLSEELFDAYQINQEHVKLDLEVEDISLDIDTIIPLGLIVNELMTNALKYAFEERDHGEIKIRFYEKNKKLFLDIEDNGVGFKNGEFEKSSSFGNKLVNTLTRQLKGKLDVSGEEGTRFHIEISDYKIAS